MDTNALGLRGESIFNTVITRYHGLAAPLFRPANLGDKWPVADFVIELYDRPGMFFLAQVKATRVGIAANGRIPVSAKAEAVRRLLEAPLPAFVIAVDEPQEKAYFARPRSESISSICTRFPLDDVQVCRDLREEVLRFWTSHATGLRWSSSFEDSSHGREQ